VKFRLPVFLQLSFLLIFFSISSSFAAIYLFKISAKEIIEDEIFSKYLRESETIVKNLEPILKEYENKINICILNKRNCDSSYIRISNLQDIITKEKLIKINNSNFYYSEEYAATQLYIFQASKEYIVSLEAIQNFLLDISVIRDNYILAINNEGYVIFNISSPFHTGDKLPLDADTLLKLKSEIVSGNFYLNDPNTALQTMNLFHSLPYLNLKLVIGNENRFVFYELNKIETNARKIFLIIIPAILLLSFVVSRFQKNRFQRISAAIKEFSNENFKTRIAEGFFKEMDEVDDLVSAFNFMADELEKFHRMNINKIIEVNDKLLKTNDELIEAKAIAEEANKAKTQFLANMSHDIRTPLNAITGFTQIIEQDDEYPKLHPAIKNHINGISLSGKNLVELINNILDLSKIEAGKMELNEEGINVKILFQSIYSINNSQAQAKEITMHFNIDPNLPDFILIDRTKLNQILMNLCSNAIKFSPKNSNIKLEAISKNDFIEFSVTDEGIGIPKEKLLTIFDAYEQSDKTITSKFGGTGLGLSIVKKITELMGGNIFVQSEPGIKTCFSVLLPLRPFLIEKEKKENKNVIFNKPYKILIIDDNQMNYEILKLHLRKIGLESFYANNGQKGLEMAIEKEPDLILLDIHMPGMNGIEVRKEILKNNKLIKIPTIVMSADVFSDQKEKVLGVAFSDFISKPINFNELNLILEKNLKEIGKI
jgi:signal transduction histidine kinase/ActR/RegA family two-component response regulator